MWRRSRTYRWRLMIIGIVGLDGQIGQAELSLQMLKRPD